MRWKEPVVLVMIMAACILVMVLVLRYEAKIDGYGKLETEWLGSIIYGKYPFLGWNQNPKKWGGKEPPVQFMDVTVEIGLRQDGVMVWRNKKGETK